MAAMNVIRKVLPYSTLAVAGAAAYSGWIMYSRYRDARAAEERIEKAKKDRSIEQGRWVNDVLGDEVKILSFAADPGVSIAQCSHHIGSGLNRSGFFQLFDSRRRFAFFKQRLA